MNLKHIILILVMILLMKNVLAIGITPGRISLDYLPGKAKSFKVEIINNQHKNFNAVVYVKGELKDYIKLDKEIIEVRQSQYLVPVTFKVNLPDLEPGMHQTDLVILELPEEFISETEGVVSDLRTLVSATIAVASTITVDVPYPGKYLKIDLDVSEANAGDYINFIIPLYNLGEENIDNVNAEIFILGATNEEIARLDTNSLSIKSKEKRELVASWKANVNPGKYRAKVKVNYDGNVAKIEKNFGVGDLFIDIIDIKVNNFKLGDIAKFEVLTESKWNEDISGVYSELLISKDNLVIANVKSASYEVKALSKQYIDIYWDTARVKEGSYDARIILHYRGKTTEKPLKAKIGLNQLSLEFLGKAIYQKKESKGKGTAITLLVIVLIIINVSWFIYLRRRKV